jgi:signal transduction histidine kinase
MQLSSADIAQQLTELRKRIMAKEENSLNEALGLHEQAIATGDTELMVKAKVEVATAYFALKSDYRTALSVLEEALAYSNEKANPALKVLVLKLMGVNYYFLTEVSKSQEKYHSAIAIIEAIPNPTNEIIKENAELYHNLSVLHRSADFVDVVDDLANKAYQLYYSIGDNAGMAKTYITRGNQQLYQNKFAEALPFYLKAVELYEKAGNIKDITVAYNNIATCYFNLQGHDKSIEYLEKSLAIREKYGNPNEQAVTIMLLGEAYFKINNTAKAKEYLHRALEIFERLNNRFDLTYVYFDLSDVYHKEGDFANAYKYLKLHRDLQEELYKTEKVRIISEAQSKFELNQKEKEAELLRKKNAEIEEYSHKLEISNSELRQFTYVASHDLKEPLRMIGSYVGLLQKRLGGKLNEEEEQFMRYVVDGTKRMDSLIRDLLDFSKINTRLEPEHVNLNEIITEVKHNLAETIREKNAEITTEELPVVLADRTHMLQLFQNLAGNGIKYNVKNKPTVHINFRTNGYELIFAVEDNGIGVADEYREQIFDIFKRLHTKDEFSGSGIGLSICKKIVEQMKGRIWVESNSNGGATFKFSVPVERLVNG